MRRFVAASSTILALACAGPSQHGKNATSDTNGVDDPTLARLVQDHWDWTLANYPELATRLGDHRYDDRLTDESWAAHEKRWNELRGLLARAQAIAGGVTSDRDRVTLELLKEELTGSASEADCLFPLWSLSARGNPVTELNYLPQSNLLLDAQGSAALLKRYEDAARQVRAHSENLRLGASRGYFANRESASRVLKMLDEQLAPPVEDWSMVSDAKRFVRASSDRTYDARLIGILREQVQPALQEYRSVIQDVVLPGARRPPQAVGLSGLPFGEACYRGRVRHFTTKDLSPDEIHQRGLEEVERINAEMQRLGRELFGLETLEETLSFLRSGSDPRLMFTSKEEITQKAEAILRRANDAVPSAFGRLPKARCEVREIPEYEAPFTTVAYYRQPVPGDVRPGEYYVNTYAPQTRTRYEAEALAFHEAVPGHHLQIAIAQELSDLPTFRRHLGLTFFVEGWALYAEKLAAELGLYSEQLDHLGRLSFEAWRAARLVVDTGIHALGWSREEAVRYMMSHTALARNNVDNEIDRYIVWPGQALAYKLGELEILRLRKRAQDALGDGFDLKTFHDVVLEGGAVSADILEEQVDAWVRSAASAQSKGR
ncbi:MAG: DUF885 domain-containing protein [Myxococcales bacterium]|nr:DUF885 domain-containing protein [Myxococcales bacterium]